MPNGSKYTRADVVLGGDGERIRSAAFEALMFYAPDGTSTYLSLMHVEGELDGRSGGFTLEGRGRFDGTTARSEYSVIDGSGTGELLGISGRGESASTHQDYPTMPLTLTYELT
jgi:hypothetical protein